MLRHTMQGVLPGLSTFMRCYQDLIDSLCLKAEDARGFEFFLRAHDKINLWCVRVSLSKPPRSCCLGVV